VPSVDNEPERPKLSSQYRLPPKDATKKGSVITKSRTDLLQEAEERRKERRALDQAAGRSIDAFTNRDDTPEPEGGVTSTVEPNPDRQSSQATEFFASFARPLNPPVNLTPERTMAPPETQATNNFSLITMTAAQLEELVQRCARANAGPAGPAGRQIANITKDLRIPDPSPFSGHSDELDPFLLECEQRFRIQPDIFNTADKKAFYVLSLFKGKLARIWKEQFLKSREGQNLIAVDWAAFRKALKDSFTEEGRTQDAQKELQEIRQGKMDVDELNTKFRLLLQRAGVDPTQNPQLIIRMYESAINRNIASQIILAGAPDTLDEWMTKASQIDRAYKRSNRLFAGAASFKRKDNHRQKPKSFHGDSSNRNQSMGEPMDIDRLSPQENERRKKAKLCFECGESGHFASAHRNGTLPAVAFTGSTNKGKGKQTKRPFTKKKQYNSDQLRTTIRAMIEDNFDDNDPEYEKFLEDVEEKGFS